MAKGNIDPAMRPAVVLQKSQMGGGGGMDGYERAMKRLRYQQMQQAQEERSRATTERGLADLNEAISKMQGWEDQQGFDEIMKDHQKVIDLYLELSKRGMNLVAPKSEKEIYAYKAIQNAHSNIIKKINAWEQNKAVKQKVEEAYRIDSQRPITEQLYNWDETFAELEKQKQPGILDRNMNVNNILIRNYNISDIIEYGDLIKDKLEQPDTITETIPDEDTGIPYDVTTTRLTQAQINSNKEKLARHYRTAPDKLKETVKKIKERDPSLSMLTDEEYFVSLVMPEVREQWSRKMRGTSSGGLEITFLGQKRKLPPAEKADNPVPFGGRTYSERYQFASSPTYTVPVGLVSTYHMGQADPESGSDGWASVGNAGGEIEATLRFYDPKRDEFVFRTTQSNQMPPFAMANTTFAIPRSVIGKEADNLKIVNDEGKTVSLSTVYPKEDANEPKKLPVPGGFWGQEETEEKEESQPRPPLKIW